MKKILLAFGLLLSISAGAQVATKAEQIRFFPHGDQSLAARILAIRNAKKSVDIISYDFEACDSSTKMIIEELEKKKIAVRLIVDDYDLPKNTKYQLARYFYKHRIAFRIFNDGDYPKFPMQLRRSHVKAMIIDGTTYFVGGRNLTDQYFGLSPKNNFFDQDLQITGPSAKTAAREYQTVWNGSENPHGVEDSSAFEKTCFTKSKRDEQVAAHVEEVATGLMDSLPAYSCGPVTYTMDPPDSPHNMPKKITTNMIINYISKTKSSLNMANQYYDPVDWEVRYLSQVRDQVKGVKINIFTNRISDAGGPLNSAAIRMTRETLQAVSRDSRKNMNIYLMSGVGSMRDDGPLSYATAPWRIHTKSFVRDHKDVVVSSFNIDTLSYMDNLESAAQIPNCPDLAAAIEAEYKTLGEMYHKDLSCEACKNEISSLGPLNTPFFLIDFVDL